MKRFLSYFLILGVLIGAGIYYGWTQYPIYKEKKEGSFGLKEIEDVEKIVMTSMEGNTMFLSKKSGNWLVNEKYPPKKDVMELLLDAIERVEYQYPVPKAGHNNVIKDIMTSSIKVEIFGKNDKRLKSYWVGGATLDGRGTYMLMDLNGKAASRPYVAYIPGFRGYLTSRYIPDEEAWRSREVFHLKAEQVQSLRVEYPETEPLSFVINKASKSAFELLPIDEKYRFPDTPTTRYIFQYLSNFESIHVESFSNSNKSKDSIKGTLPFCHFEMTEVSGKKTSLKLYRMPVNKRTKAVMEMPDGSTYDGDRFYFWLNETDFGILQYYVWGKMFRKYNDFFFKPAAQGHKR